MRLAGKLTVIERSLSLQSTIDNSSDLLDYQRLELPLEKSATGEDLFLDCFN